MIMKILFVNNARGRGGGEEFLRDLLPGLTAKGVQVGLLCRPGTPLAEMFEDSSIMLHPIERSGVHGVSAILATARVIREGGYEIVNVQRGHDVVQSWLGRRLSGRRPLLLYTPQVPEFIKSRFLLSRMTNIVTISRYIRDKVISFSSGLAPRIRIIYYGIDLNKFKKGEVPRGFLRGRFPLAMDTPLLGTVGDLWKNQVEFLDALVLIRKQVPDARFALTASETGSELTETFKRRAAQLGLTDAIIWTGRLSKQDMLSFYADIDVAISTHRNEGFGIWVLEALAMGTPVVSVNEGGIRDSLEGCPAGVLVDNGPEHMAAAVVRILKDPSLHARMAEAGSLWISKRFSKERMLNDYYDYFRSLIGPGTPHRS
jgi:glycosyltransferase involved in cell wall biosynthesis